MALICNSIPVFETNPFVGCDGKVWSDELVKFHQDKAAKEEDYEWAAECRDELIRRQNEKQAQ